MENEENNVSKIINEKKSSNKKLIAGIAVIALLAIVILTGGFGMLTGNVTDPGDQGEFTISVSEITTQASWYEYDSSGVNVRFFAVEADDGSIKTGFDACDVCFNSKKGYRQEGEYMVCNNCGNKYPINGLGTENTNPGGCWPGYLDNKIVNGNLIIKKADLENGRNRFL